MAKDSQATQEIVKWLSPEPYNTIYETIRSRRQQGTGGWFIDEVKTWLQNPSLSPVYWCKGIPGAGKTVLVSTVIDYISESTDFKLAYTYFNYKDISNQSPSAMYASMVSQLLHKVPCVLSAAQRLFVECDNGHRNATANELFEILLSIPDSFRVLIVLDALDEASEATRSDLLRRLPHTRGSMLVLLSSRPDIKLEMGHVVEVVAQPADLEAFIQARLSEKNVQRVIGKGSEIVQKIVQTLVSRAGGM